MKATNSLTSAGKKPSFSMVINSNAMKSMIEKSLGDSRRAASFTSTLISAVTSSPRLAACKPESIVSAALKGEGMGLSLALNQYSIVPYGDIANYQISYKGIAQLASRSNQYSDIGVFDVREGEYKGKDTRTRQPIIEWMDDDEREDKPLAGFYGFYELKSGFFKSIYWSHDKILNHADRYSKAFSKEKYLDMLAGKLSAEEAEKLKSGSPWNDEPLSESHMKMCKKTVLLQMLGDGIAPLSIEMQFALNNEKVSEASEGGLIYENDPVVEQQNAPKEETIIEAEVEDKPEDNIPAPTKPKKKGGLEVVGEEQMEMPME